MLVLSKWTSESSFGFPENSGLKCDQFNCGICCACYVGCCNAGGGRVTGTAGACGPAFAIFILYYVILLFYIIILFIFFL